MATRTLTTCRYCRSIISYQYRINVPVVMRKNKDREREDRTPSLMWLMIFVAMETMMPLICSGLLLALAQKGMPRNQKKLPLQLLVGDMWAGCWRSVWSVCVKNLTKSTFYLCTLEHACPSWWMWLAGVWWKSWFFLFYILQRVVANWLLRNDKKCICFIHVLIKISW